MFTWRTSRSQDFFAQNSRLDLYLPYRSTPKHTVDEERPVTVVSKYKLDLYTAICGNYALYP